MDFVLSWEVLLLLFALAMLAGFVDTLAGGGGLITVPVLLLSGLPPIHALATVSYTHLTLPTILRSCRSRWSPYH